MERQAKIYVAGHSGLVGSAIVRKLQEEGYNNLVFTPHTEVDLIDQKQVYDFFERERPEYVFLAAAKVGGILANSEYPADFIYQNLMIEANIIHCAHIFNVKKLLFLGSSCIYPKNCPQPIKEEYLLTGLLEETNEAYALAKISGLKMCEYYRKQYGDDFISAMPTNMYGLNDNYNLETSHVLPALIRKMHLAKCLEMNDFEAIRKDLKKYPYSNKVLYSDSMTDQDLLKLLNNIGIERINNTSLNSSNSWTVTLTLWGTGEPYREFLFSDDLADALLFMMNNYSDFVHLNVGTGEDLKIKEIAILVKNHVGFQGILKWDAGKPSGTPRKKLDVSRLHAIGWSEKVSLEEGIRQVYTSYQVNTESF